MSSQDPLTEERKIKEGAGPKDEAQAVTLSGMLSLITALSIISLFFVTPYSIGYFLFFDLGIMPLFSLIDFYMYFSVPLIAGLIFFFGYTFQPLAIAAMKSKGRTEGTVHRTATRYRKVAYPIFAVMLLLLFGQMAVAASIPIITFVLSIFLVATVSLLKVRVVPISNVLFFAIVSPLLFLNLLSLGHIQASEQHRLKQKIEVTYEEKDSVKKVDGNVFFVGNSGIAFFDDDENQHFVRIDKNISVKFGKINDFSKYGCFDRFYIKEIREYIGLDNCIFTPPWYRFFGYKAQRRAY